MNSLEIKMSARDQRHMDPKIRLQAIVGQWLPLAAAVLNAVCRHSPSPLQIDRERIDRLVGSNIGEKSIIKEAIRLCRSGNWETEEREEEVPTIVFVSKMFAVERRFLPSNRHQPLTSEEIHRRRQEAMEKQQKVNCSIMRNFLPRISRGVPISTTTSSESVTNATLHLGVVYLGGSHAPLERLESDNRLPELSQCPIKDHRGTT